jgi:hypothetical protein
MARKVVYCPYCSATNGAVKKAGALKIIHDKFRAKKTAEELEKFRKTFANAVESQKDLGMYVNRAIHEDLNPLKVLDLFRRMSDEVSSLRIAYHLIFHCFSSTFHRTASFWVSDLRMVGPRSSSGNTSPFLRLLFAHQSNKMVLRTKMT